MNSPETENSLEEVPKLMMGSNTSETGRAIWLWYLSCLTKLFFFTMYGLSSLLDATGQLSSSSALYFVIQLQLVQNVLGHSQKNKYN